ncbi:SDR family NAD(P)-dependent oxidoreductase [Liquorilactobacillus uvarum]|uniref:SDR family NAD(P)-dependent oxidoreductase n=1 Tax=Liquorilactobacillus uvarum TaxID=303240 RepID=UPI002889B52F|nr:SDR family NAD(P)-dependent oxidoreductase [Liquorilactobacillus uvarum]
MGFTVITGASSGIGYATAKEFAKKDHNLILVARNQEKLIELKKQLLKEKPELKVIIKSIDLSNINLVHEFIKFLESKDLDLLINNAGFGDAGEMLNSDISKIEKMLDLDVKTLVTLSLWFAKKYSDQLDKQIINVSSTAGYDINTRAVLYSASKNFVAAFTEGLALELKRAKFPLQAKVIAPYATSTNFANVSLDTRNFSYEKNYGKYHTPEQMASFIVQLYNSTSVVGKINAETMELELSDTLLNWHA